MKSKLQLPEKLLALLAGLVFSSTAVADGFAATVSPPRFELQGKPGETLNRVVEISNTARQVSAFDLRTADWDISESGNVTIHPPELRPGSCRPWTRIERRKIRLAPESARRYRFQINIPEDAAAGECRVALLLEGAGEETIMVGTEEVRFPVQGRIAVIIYVRVGDAAPQLELLELGMQTVNAQEVPVVVFRNEGNAHGRPSGILAGSDALGRELEFTVSPGPILPGQTRRIPVWPAMADGSEAAGIVPPLQLKGVIEWDGGEQEIDTTVSPTHRIGLTETGP